MQNPLQLVKSLIPQLTNNLYKGQCGKIGVVGGCLEYTGAPYYCAISALKTGADLAHVFCTRDAGVAIKAYSPELIVHPVLLESHSAKANEAKLPLEHITDWISRLSVLVIGSGLGRDPLVMDTATQLIEHARDAKIPLVLDAVNILILGK
jgi:ATP-dependent NAD(P)H-hydrate dehydratase